MLWDEHNRSQYYRNERSVDEPRSQWRRPLVAPTGPPTVQSPSDTSVEDLAQKEPVQDGMDFTYADTNQNEIEHWE